MRDVMLARLHFPWYALRPGPAAVCASNCCECQVNSPWAFFRRCECRDVLSRLSDCTCTPRQHAAGAARRHSTPAINLMMAHSQQHSSRTQLLTNLNMIYARLLLASASYCSSIPVPLWRATASRACCRGLYTQHAALAYLSS